jgi:hypothetical protein
MVCTASKKGFNGRLQSRRRAELIYNKPVSAVVGNGAKAFMAVRRLAYLAKNRALSNKPREKTPQVNAIAFSENIRKKGRKEMKAYVIDQEDLRKNIGICRENRRQR